MEAFVFCLVVAISDGDTLKVRCQGAPMQVIRLAEVDAPEKRQPFGERSRQHLAELCHEKPAEVRSRGKDRYGRIVARVECDGQDASAVQARAGMAWAFTRYLTDPTIKTAEGEAKALGRGLWADQAPVAPWEWRKARR